MGNLAMTLKELEMYKRHDNFSENKDLANTPNQGTEEHDPEYVSTCCNASAFGNSFIEEELTGICNKCYDGANFEDLYEEEG